MDLKVPNVNFAALNNLFQNELLIIALYTNLSEDGREESELEMDAMNSHFSPHTIQIQTNKF